MHNYITLNHNSDFRRLYNKGRSYANPALVTYFNKNRAGICRIGITSSKKIGNAVERNKSRRLIRAAFDEIFKKYESNLSGYDFVFVARSKTKYIKSTDLSKIMETHLRQANLIGEEE